MKKIVLALFLTVATLIPARAQLFQMGLKLQYSTESIDQMINQVTQEYQNFSTDFLKGCEAGLFLRVNIGRWISLQPEANFSIGSIWDSVDAQTDFISSVTTAFSNVQTINLSVPVLLGVHLLDIEKLLALRIYGGPEFYTTIKGATETGMDFSKYSLVFGAGIDLLGFIYVDGRISRYSSGDMFYRLGVGLIF